MTNFYNTYFCTKIQKPLRQMTNSGKKYLPRKRLNKLYQLMQIVIIDDIQKLFLRKNTAFNPCVTNVDE